MRTQLANTLLDHYTQYGVPPEVAEQILSLDEGAEDISNLVRARIAALLKKDPFWTDTDVIEHRIIKSAADELNIQMPEPVGEPPEMLPQERKFKREFETNPPLTLEELEKKLQQFRLSQREGISPRIRTMVARHIVSLFKDDPRAILDCLLSNNVQKFLTENEYYILFQNIKKETREKLVNDLIMADHFAQMDGTAQQILLTTMEQTLEAKKLAQNIRRIVGQQALTFLSSQTFSQILHIVVKMQLLDFFHSIMRQRFEGETTALRAAINDMIDMLNEQNASFLLINLHQYIELFTEEERMAIKWKKIFIALKNQKNHFLKYWNLFPKSIKNAFIWNRIVLAAAEQDHESIIADVLSYTQGIQFDSRTVSQLTQKALQKGWSEATFKHIVTPKK